MHEHAPSITQHDTEASNGFRLVGKHSELGAEEALAHFFREEHQLPSDFPAEIEKTPEQIEQIYALQSALTDYASSLGVDISGQLPHLNQVHLYDEVAFSELRKKLGRGDETEAFTFSSGHMLIEVPKDGDESNFLDSINHEQIHSLTPKSVQVEVDDETGNIDGIAFVRAGLSPIKTRAFHVVDEIVTERINRESQKLWPNYPVLAKVEPITDHGSYRYDMRAGQQIVEHVAAESNRPATEIWLELERGELQGDMKSLRTIAAVVGTEGMRTLAEYKTDGPQYAGEVALKLTGVEIDTN